jgi:hypothetical protein
VLLEGNNNNSSSSNHLLNKTSRINNRIISSRIQIRKMKEEMVEMQEMAVMVVPV